MHTLQDHFICLHSYNNKQDHYIMYYAYYIYIYIYVNTIYTTIQHILQCCIVYHTIVGAHAEVSRKGSGLYTLTARGTYILPQRTITKEDLPHLLQERKLQYFRSPVKITGTSLQVAFNCKCTAYQVVEEYQFLMHYSRIYYDASYAYTVYSFETSNHYSLLLYF